ncbi:Olfactory Receptor 5V1, partial [Manis pentadactyla]
REEMDGYNLTTVSHFVVAGLSDLPEVRYPLFMVFAVTYQVTLVGNGAILLAIGMEKMLHTSMYYFLANLSLLDISCPSATVPKMLDNLLTGNHSISFLGCALQLYFLVALAETEVFLLAVMAYDWYMAICFPSSNRVNQYYCDIPPVVALSCSSTYMAEMLVLVAGGVSGIGAFLTTFISYIYIISTILKIQSVEGKHKTFSTCASHLLVVCLFYGTAIFTYVHPSSSHHSPDRDRLIAMLYGVITPMLNPMIYSLRSTE